MGSFDIWKGESSLRVFFPSSLTIMRSSRVELLPRYDRTNLHQRRGHSRNIPRRLCTLAQENEQSRPLFPSFENDPQTHQQALLAPSKLHNTKARTSTSQWIPRTLVNHHRLHAKSQPRESHAEICMPRKAYSAPDSDPASHATTRIPDANATRATDKDNSEPNRKKQ